MARRHFRARLIVVIIVALISTTAFVATPASAGASGGGCATTSGIRPCISFASGTRNPLLADFYLISYGTPRPVYADLWICLGFNCYWQLRAHVDHLGRYPQVDQTVGWPGSAHTLVQLLTQDNVVLREAVSPTIYYS
jgi:hypothetical protein